MNALHAPAPRTSEAAADRAGGPGAAPAAGLSAAALAAATPADRDRYVDFLRVFSIGTVVAGHWLMAVVQVRPGGVRATNALAAMPSAQVLTWLLQVMPVFFFVGGFAHATGLRSVESRGGGYADFVRARVGRLLRPTAVFLALWTVVAVALELGGWQDGIGGLASATIVQPLWFVGVYLGIVALAPPMYRWHRRHGAAVVAVLAVAAVAVDAVRFGLGLPEVGVLNLAFVWLAAHQAGFLYADGVLTRRKRTGAALAVAGLAAVVALTVVTHLYPVSMVGLPGERISNMNPPTVALAAHATWLIGLVLLLRGPVTRWLAGRRVWTVVVGANGVVMTTFLWHLTALFAVYAAVLASPLPLPRVGSAAWWLSRPVWIAVLALVCAALVSMFRWAERPRRVTITGGGAAAAVVGSTAACLGILGVALTGLDGLLAGHSTTLVIIPMTATAGITLLTAGWALVGGRCGQAR